VLLRAASVPGTSRNRKTPLSYMQDDGRNVLWKLQPHTETDDGFHRGASIDILSQFSNEQEVLFPPCTMLEVKVAIRHPLGIRSRLGKHMKSFQAVKRLLSGSSDGSHSAMADVCASAAGTETNHSEQSGCDQSQGFAASRPTQLRPPAISLNGDPTSRVAPISAPPLGDQRTVEAIEADSSTALHSDMTDMAVDVRGNDMPAILDPIMASQAMKKMDPYHSQHPWDVHGYDVKDGITEDGKTYMAISVMPSFL